MITHIKNIIAKAKAGGYAIGAFNTANFETTEAILSAAKNLNKPLIIQVSEKTIKYCGLATITSIIQSVDKERKIKVPIAIHLDHGHTLEVVKQCIAAGFSSVQIDGSELKYEKNIALTKAAVNLAKKRGVWVQGELGSILGKEGLVKLAHGLKPESYMTDPAQVKDFIRRTVVNTLAISVGTMHGAFVGREKIRLDRLKKIAKQAKIPLVLHGASGNKDSEVKQAIRLGIRIINIDTELRQAFIETLRKNLKGKIIKYDPRELLQPSIEAVRAKVEEKVKVFSKRN